MSVLARYLALAWLRVFGTSVAAGAALYLVIDVFDRVGEVLPFSPAWTSLVTYFLFKLPKIVFDIFPAASLLASLVSIALLARDGEIAAMRAGGMSLGRIARPMVATALLASFAALAWSEAVVPVAATRSRWLWDVELKQKTYRGVFDAASVWFQNADGFVHIRRYDAGARVIEGLSLYTADADFRLSRMVEVESMAWSGDRWVASAGLVKDIAGGDELRVRALAPGEFTMTEDPETLATRRRKPEEFSFRQLSAQIDQLQSRGLAADQYLVDLHHKLSWPFAGFVVALLGVPLALRSRRSGGLAAGTATGLVVGFAYWILTGLALSAGRTGALSPPLAAWTANAVFAALAAAMLARGDRP